MARSIILGLLLGLLVAASVYYNDYVIQQTPLLGSFLPMGIFGVIVAILLLWNPLVSRLSALQVGPLAVPVILALSLAASGWAGASFFRFFPTVVGTPGYWYQVNPGWQSNQLLAYVPGGSPEIAPGHLPEPGALARRIVADREAPTLAGAVWRHSSTAGRQVIDRAAEQSTVDPGLAYDLARTMNDALRQPSFATRETNAIDADAFDAQQRLRLTRHALVAELPDLVLPAPRGQGLLLSGGQPGEAVEQFIVGHGGELGATWRAMPWANWQPVLQFWGGLVVLLGLCTLCLALIVHPQWSRQELLPYPIAQFMDHLITRAPGEVVPTVMRVRGFWFAMVAVMGVHLMHGLHAWYETGLHIPLQFEFDPLRELFDNASRTSFSGAVFSPTLYLSMAAFAFFLPAKVSFSIGIAPLVWMMFGAAMLAKGVTLGFNRFEPEPGTLLRLGAYLGMAIMIGYTGRRYYAAVVRAGCGLPTAGADRVPGTSVWAARGLAVLLPLSVWWLTTAGMDWLLALLLVVVCLLVWLVVSRVVCETGVLMVTGPLLPVAVLTGLLGHEAIGPTQLILIMVVGLLLVGDPRDAAMPLLMHGLHLLDRRRSMPLSLARLSPWLIVAIVAGIGVAGAATLVMQHAHGLSALPHEHVRAVAPQASFRALERAVADMRVNDTLAESLQLHGWSRIMSMSPAPGFLLWITLGAGLVGATALARLRLPWWPLHPAIFIIIGTQASALVGFSFLIGWLAKVAVVGTGGASGYEAARPVAVGVISGELLAGLAWIIAGTGYYAWSGQTPPSYNIFGT
ncbi:DUF6785 family protein [Phycisphaerales bacterium AB-hyl4]|uniref:DUF6785 family protein n=1 Tax=Natronomicrosphaera hydrolytica TaxID=3242702 RepID=A0ABV4U7T9_9BACT